MNPLAALLWDEWIKKTPLFHLHGIAAVCEFTGIIIIIR
jgi:hypothetical protein